MWEMRPGFFTQEKTMAIQEKGKRVFYIPASNENPHPQLVDVLHVHDDGKTYGLYSGKTLDELALDTGADIQVIDHEAFATLQDNSYITDPKPITAERYDEALNCLPPVRWGTYRGIESFRLSELYCGNVTSIFARKGDQFWEFRDRIDISSEALASKVEAASASTATTKSLAVTA